TPDDQLSKTEHYKLASGGMAQPIAEEYRDLSSDSLSDAAEQVSKSHGIYLEYNRAKTGREKDWMFMVRISVTAGGSFNAAQWRIIDEVADRFADNNPTGGPAIRLTTRQNIQFHWVKKPAVIPMIQEIAKTGFFTLN